MGINGSRRPTIEAILLPHTPLQLTTQFVEMVPAGVDTPVTCRAPNWVLPIVTFVTGQFSITCNRKRNKNHKAYSFC